MRYRITLAALLLPLAGCVVPPPAGPSMYPGYPGYAPGYAATPYAQDFAYPGYAYNDGSPTLAVDGVVWPLVFFGGGWGYWDYYHNWHGAPGPVGNWLGQRHPGGAGYRPFGGGTWGTPGGGYRGGGYGPAGGGRPGGFAAPGGGRPGGFAAPGGGRPGGFVAPVGGGSHPAPAPSHPSGGGGGGGHNGHDEHH